jgi:hypothetical protein
VLVEDDERSGRPSTNKITENAEKFWELIHEDCRWACRHRWDQLWGLTGGLNRKFEHAPHCCEVHSLTLDKWLKAVACKCVSWAMREG